MSEEIDIYLLDDKNNPIEEANIKKPKTFLELNAEIKKNFKNLPKYYVIYYLSEDDKDIIIHNDKELEKVENILFIRKIVPNNLGVSLFTRNYDKLPQTKQDIINQKYMCSICSDLIKKENPLFCYICQKIFHHECLKKWSEQRSQKSRNLNCPNCRKELPLEEWKAKLDFEEIRKNDAEILELLNQSEDAINYSDYIIKTVDIFKKILTIINEINLIMDPEPNENINNLIKELTNNFINPPLDDISIIIFEELDKIDNYLKQYEIKENKEPEVKQDNNDNDIADANKNEINLIYVAKKDSQENIFGPEFVENNKNNIELEINGQKSPLVSQCYLKKGDNNIKIIIKNKLTNLSNMFCKCYYLKNIDELKNLDTKDVTDFENMFRYCESLSNINSLKYWDVSKGTNFKGMFSYCKSLYDLSPLQNWDVSKNIYFIEMFSFCLSLKDLNPIKNWNVSNGANFDYMFYACASLSELKPLENWNVANGINFSGMFCSCSLLIDLKPLEKWNVSNCINFQGMFSNIKYLSDLKPLENWNVSNGENFAGMFFSCEMLSDITPLENWNVSKGINFENMFGYCNELNDLNPLKKWNISNDDFQSLQKLKN